MSLESDMVAAVTGHAGAGPLVSNGDSPQTFRLYPNKAKAPPAKPYIVYTVVSGRHLATLPSGGRTSLKNARIQLSLFGDTYSSLRTLADHIYDALDTDMSVGAMSETSLYEDETELHRIDMDFSLWD